uniref:Uncharacterized protein n=1 Tax=Octopus bimaculoides TaxID=37653 RepID=A0A0L8GGA1_OCTBM
MLAKVFTPSQFVYRIKECKNSAEACLLLMDVKLVCGGWMDAFWKFFHIL